MLRFLRQFLAITVPLALALLLAAVLLCYWNRWDELVFVTLVPIWAWAGGAALFAILWWPLLKSTPCLFLCSLWLAAGIAISDETPGLARQFRAALAGGKPPALREPGDSGTLRVATLNCAASDPAAAAASLASLAPDLVLLQSAPERPALIDLTSELFGAEGTFVRSDTCAILARGQLQAAFIEPSTGSISARLERPEGGHLAVLNLHLPHAAPRWDAWTQEGRQVLVDRRKGNRRLLRVMLETLPSPSAARRAIAGGSFGAPPSDDIFRLLRRGQLADSFRRAGYGWGNTHPASLPLARLDQIWASSHYAPERSETVRAPGSEHRIVVSDFRLAAPPGELATAKTGPED